MTSNCSYPFHKYVPVSIRAIDSITQSRDISCWMKLNVPSWKGFPRAYCSSRGHGPFKNNHETSKHGPRGYFFFFLFSHFHSFPHCISRSHPPPLPPIRISTRSRRALRARLKFNSNTKPRLCGGPSTVIGCHLSLSSSALATRRRACVRAPCTCNPASNDYAARVPFVRRWIRRRQWIVWSTGEKSARVEFFEKRCRFRDTRC